METSANVTVYVNKKGTLQPLKRMQRKFRKEYRRFVVTEFVKTCNELVIGHVGPRMYPTL